MKLSKHCKFNVTIKKESLPIILDRYIRYIKLKQYKYYNRKTSQPFSPYDCLIFFINSNYRTFYHSVSINVIILKYLFLTFLWHDSIIYNCMSVAGFVQLSRTTLQVLPVEYT